MIRRMDAETLTAVYNNSMKTTFPRMELKPLKAMLRMQADGCYDVWGYYSDAGELLAYACVCNVSTPVLLDYLAVVENHRGEGLGSIFLGALMSDKSLYPAMMLEIEAVSAAEDAADREKRARRLRFYEKLGFVLTRTEAHVFGEHYWVLDNQSELGDHDVNDAMTDVYHYMVRNPLVNKKFVRVQTREDTALS
ncbi:MAG: GNAT family N-acetyltransferase [Peptococcaceae bacterium]|nr:GNAT family N-acetyltransferase [Peptococcaceae bacterium]